MTAEPPAPSSDSFKLPDLHQAVLDAGTLEHLFRDIETCTKVIEVIPKFGSRQHVPQTALALAEGKHLLLTREARALQIRYRYDGAEWWDTIMAAPNGYRVVRIQHR